MYFIAGSVLHIAEVRFDQSPALNTILNRIAEIEKQHDGEGSEEHKALNDEFDRISREIIISTFEEYGETDFATMYRQDEAAFYRLYDECKKFFIKKNISPADD